MGEVGRQCLRRRPGQGGGLGVKLHLGVVEAALQGGIDLVDLQREAAGERIAALLLFDHGAGQHGHEAEVAPLVHVHLHLLPGQARAPLEAEDVTGLPAQDGLPADADGGADGKVALIHLKDGGGGQGGPALHQPAAFNFHAEGLLRRAGSRWRAPEGEPPGTAPRRR